MLHLGIFPVSFYMQLFLGVRSRPEGRDMDGTACIMIITR